MASRSNGNGATATKPPAEKKNPLYHVVSVNPDDEAKIEIIKLAVPAPTQEKAMDKVADTLEGEFTLGAFLASSLKAKKYVRKMQPVMEGTATTLFGGTVGPTPTPVQE